MRPSFSGGGKVVCGAGIEGMATGGSLAGNSAGDKVAPGVAFVQERVANTEISSMIPRMTFFISHPPEPHRELPGPLPGYYSYKYTLSAKAYYTRPDYFFPNI
jgi:hypothetical protein